MINYPKTIRNFNAFVDGISYAGRVLEGKLPEPKLKTAEHRGGGMDAPIDIDMGMDKMEAEITLAEWSPELIALLGSNKRLVLRPYSQNQNDATVKGYIFTMGGLWQSTNFGDLKPDSDAPLKVMLSVDYLRIEHEGAELMEIDVQAGKRVIGGKDQFQAQRAAMGF